jgi:hypothetical protein
LSLTLASGPNRPWQARAARPGLIPGGRGRPRSGARSRPATPRACRARRAATHGSRLWATPTPEISKVSPSNGRTRPLIVSARADHVGQAIMAKMAITDESRHMVCAIVEPPFISIESPPICGWLYLYRVHDYETYRACIKRLCPCRAGRRGPGHPQLSPKTQSPSSTRHRLRKPASRVM